MIQANATLLTTNEREIKVVFVLFIEAVVTMNGMAIEFAESIQNV